MRYESERGIRRGIYDLSGFGTCCVHGNAVELSWKKTTPSGKDRCQEAPQTTEETAKLNDGGKSFTWKGLAFEKMKEDEAL